MKTPLKAVLADGNNNEVVGNALKLEGIPRDTDNKGPPEEDNIGIKEGTLKPKDLDDSPDNANGSPDDPLGNEKGNELKPGKEELDHNGPQIGNVANKTKLDNDEPTGPDDEITKGAANDVKNGNNTVDDELNEE
ncbi:MAG: hypothetical protein N4Q30_05030 [Neisseriaceae bacterium]|nr:hypothetical protein [Neisseriaceae bacterium]